MLRSLIAIFAVLALAGAAFGQNLPSSKATAQINTLVKCNMTGAQVVDGVSVAVPGTCVDLFDGASVATKDQWIKIMEKPMKLSNSQSVFVSPSLVSGLYTQTKTVTKTGSVSTAQAMGAVYLRAVLVPQAGGDPIVGAPISACNPNIFGCAQPEAGKWGVTLDSRVQTLSQELSACVIDVTSIAGTNDGSCTFTSTIDLILKTTSANTFNFIFPNVGQGIYNVQIWAAVGSGATIISGNGLAIGAAAFGLGSMTAESVRLVHDFQF